MKKLGKINVDPKNGAEQEADDIGGGRGLQEAGKETGKEECYCIGSGAGDTTGARRLCRRLDPILDRRQEAESLARSQVSLGWERQVTLAVDCHTHSSSGLPHSQ